MAIRSAKLFFPTAVVFIHSGDMEIQPRLAQVSSFVKDESSWNGPNGIIMGPSAIMLQIDAI